MRQSTRLTRPLIILLPAITRSSHLNAKSFNMLLTLQQLLKGGVNIKGWWEFSFRTKLKRTLTSTISTEASSISDSNEETLNLNKTCIKNLNKKIENNWDIKPNLPQQIVLQKMLEKVFVAKKFTQCKTSHTLCNIRFEIPENKNFGNCVQNVNCFSWIKLIPSSDPCHIVILQFPVLIASLSPPISVKFYPSRLKPLFNAIFIKFFIGFPVLLYPIQPRITTRIWYA